MSLVNQLTELIDSRQKLDAEREALEAKAAEIAERVKVIDETLIPDMMMSAGLSEIKTPNGLKVSVGKFYSVKPPHPNALYDWLDENGYGDLIKHNFEVPLPRDSAEEATRVRETLRSLKVKFVEDESVHAQTLKAFCREQTEKGIHLPMDLFGLYIGNKAKIEKL